MAIIASWKDKKWEVSTKKIYNIENFTTTFKLKTNENQDKEGSPPVNIRGNELIPIDFDITLSDAVGIDVRAEIDSWEKLVGESGPFHIGGKRFGPEFMQLHEVNVNEAVIDDLGRIRSAKVGLSFLENAEEADKAKTALTGISAMGVGASTQDKSAMKPDNNQIKNATSSGIKAGSTIKIIGTKYATGQNVPQWVKDKTHVVTKISGEKALIGGGGGINSWVNLKDLSLA